MDECLNYSCSLRLSANCSGNQKMTALLYAIDFVKETTGVATLENNATELRFDRENLTTPEEILKTQMEDLLIMRIGEINPFFD